MINEVEEGRDKHASVASVLASCSGGTADKPRNQLVLKIFINGK